jgi:hypothetical protein
MRHYGYRFLFDPERVIYNSWGQATAPPPDLWQKDFDPEGVAYSRLRCDPFRVGFFFCVKPGAALSLAPGYFVHPLRG